MHPEPATGSLTWFTPGARCAPPPACSHPWDCRSGGAPLKVPVRGPNYVWEGGSLASGTGQTPTRELARLQALARVAGAAAGSGGLEAVLTAIVDGVQEAF